MAEELLSRADARARGLSRYWTGKPCKHGHIAERIVANGACVECVALISKRYKERDPEHFRELRRGVEQKYRDLHREKVREKDRRSWAAAPVERRQRHRAADKKYREANKEKERERSARWAAANPEKVRARDKRWRDANPDKIRVKNKRYKAENAERLAPIARERTKQWEKDNPEKAAENHRVVQRRRRARVAGIEGDHTRAETDALLRTQRFICAEPTCGADIHKHRHLDHVHPIARGGSNGIENLQWLCPSCNRRKGARDPAEWAQINGRLL
ncbi:MAG: HNH endonuclease signature motif containing protein [Beijerinckiaceae bacterium]|nr:HNH endonuclease signature motif containing protein [Beijerinckiaceae bacterium]